MMDILGNVAIAVVGLLLYVFAWRVVADLPLLVRGLARIILALVVIGPLVLLIVSQSQPAREAARRDAPAGDAAQPKSAPSAPTTSPVQPPAASPKSADREAAPAKPGAPAPSPADQLEKVQREAEKARAAHEAERERRIAETKRMARESMEREAAGLDDKVVAKKGMEPMGSGGPTGHSASPRPSSAQPPAPPPPPPPAAAPTAGAEPPPAASTPGQPRSIAAPSPKATAPPPAPESAPPAAAPAPAPAAPPAAAPPAPAKEEAKADYEVVPVYFGTDRAVEPNDKRLMFGYTRGRRLELGRALVTVPKVHKVPLVERPWSITIPYFDVKIYEEAEDPKRHFTMQEIKALTKEQMLALVRERLAASAAFKDHALVFIHGYNTKFDTAVYRTAQITYDLKFDGAPFLYSWPSGGGIASYTYDRESALQAEPYLRQFLEMVVKETGAKHVSIVAHSMGNQLLLQVLRELRMSAPEGVQISQLILAAPDVDRDNFENLARLIKGLAKGVTLYAASNDKALNASRTFHGGVPRAGDVPEGVPLIVEGVDTIDVTAVSTDSLGLHHSGYAENNALLNDIGRLIQTGERPPEARVPILQRLKTDKGEYWRYPTQP